MSTETREWTPTYDDVAQAVEVLRAVWDRAGLARDVLDAAVRELPKYRYPGMTDDEADAIAGDDRITRDGFGYVVSHVLAIPRPHEHRGDPVDPCRTCGRNRESRLH